MDRDGPAIVSQIFMSSSVLRQSAEEKGTSKGEKEKGTGRRDGLEKSGDRRDISQKCFFQFSLSQNRIEV